jgi:hypothetical protein
MDNEGASQRDLHSTVKGTHQRVLHLEHLVEEGFGRLLEQGAHHQESLQSIETEMHSQWAKMRVVLLELGQKTSRRGFSSVALGAGVTIVIFWFARSI